MNGSAKPTPKVAAAAGVGVPLALVISWVAGQLGVEMPTEVASSIGALVAAAVAYLKRD